MLRAGDVASGRASTPLRRPGRQGRTFGHEARGGRAVRATQAKRPPVGDRSGLGRSVWFSCVLVAGIVVVLHPVPASVDVHVGDDLTTF